MLSAISRWDKAEALKQVLSDLKAEKVFDEPGPQRQHDVLPRIMMLLWDGVPKIAKGHCPTPLVARS